jgi:acetyltransferase-like isoleucine patch superfamily enzyme
MIIAGLKAALLRVRARVAFSAKIDPAAYVDKHTLLEGYNAIGAGTEVRKSVLGLGTYISQRSIIRAAKIGRFCAIGDNVRTCIGAHPVTKHVSIHPSFFSSTSPVNLPLYANHTFKEHVYVDSDKKYVVEVGNDVWIGNNVSIMDGVTIGDGAVIGLGAIVTREVAPYTINIGIPARRTGQRFTDEQIASLLEIKWWENEVDWIRKNAQHFDNVERFINVCRKQL